MTGVLSRMRGFARQLRRSPLAAEISTHVPEITSFTPRSAQDSGRRLNLLLPSINAQHYFGGIHTAVMLYRELCRHFPRSRIIVVDSPPGAAALARFPDHELALCDTNSLAARQITPFSDRYGRTLPIEPHDRWLATAWWTAHAAQRLQDWQARQYSAHEPLAYLIQDFEPSFYPWSSQSALALATYRPERDLGIFNTRMLADYFAMQGLRYDKMWTFEPTLNQDLRDQFRIVSAQGRASRKRRIVVYGRPSTPRNGFELICEALRHWGWAEPTARQWEIVAPGEIAASIDLGPVRVEALGKLPIDAYAQLLASSAIGLSLMVSPHPSYPPLEMAAFGMRVVTNRFANKDLSQFTPNIRSVPSLTPDGIAATLSACCAEFESAGHESMPPFSMDHSFMAEGGFEALATQLAAEWA